MDLRTPWVTLLFIVSVLILPLSAQETDVRIARATRINTAPAIDGLLEDPVWRQAVPLSDFVQAEPFEGESATEKTEVRILYNRETLFIGVICYDSEPARMVVTDSRRDSSMDEMDSFQIILDTYHDRQNGFVFGTNPAGIEFDGQVSNEGQGGARGGEAGGGGRAQAGSGGGFNLNWDGSWQVKSHVNEIGWMAEFAIPFRSLRYGPNRTQIWGINFMRNIRRKREEIYWSPVSRIYNLYRLSSAGELRGLDLEAPRNLKVTPYVTGSALRDYAAKSRTAWDGNAGGDLKLGLTPSLNLDMTVNTDFAQVEVDEQQINLTRFNLFFPEKRPFFLENAGIFAVGKPQAVDLFFSRRIGIDDSRTEVPIAVPIVAGARLSGKARAFNVGLLNMQTGDVRGVPANNFTVARISRELPNRSHLGGIFLNRSATGRLGSASDWNRTWGVDGKLGVGERLTFDGFAARTETPGRLGPEHSLNMKGEYQRLAGRIYADYTEVGAGFNPEMGFLVRRDYRNIEAGAAANVRRRQLTWLREFRPHVTYDSFWDFAGFQESDRLHMSAPFDFENGASITSTVNVTLEGLKKPFEVFPGIIVARGSYRNAEFNFRINSDRRAWLSGGAELTHGGFLSGSQRSFNLDTSLRRGSQLSSSLRWTRKSITLREGAFETNLLQWKFNYSFTPFTYFQYLVQYNDRIQNVSANVRLGWLNTAGTGLVIVYNETRRLSGSSPLTRVVILKYTRQFDLFR